MTVEHVDKLWLFSSHSLRFRTILWLYLNTHIPENFFKDMKTIFQLFWNIFRIFWVDIFSLTILDIFCHFLYNRYLGKTKLIEIIKWSEQAKTQHLPQSVACKYRNKFGDFWILELQRGDNKELRPLENANHYKMMEKLIQWELKVDKHLFIQEMGGFLHYKRRRVVNTYKHFLFYFIGISTITEYFKTYLDNFSKHFETYLALSEWTFFCWHF